MSTILKYKYVTTRKPHICFGCSRNILSPARMASVAYADGGTADARWEAEEFFVEPDETFYDYKYSEDE